MKGGKEGNLLPRSGGKTGWKEKRRKVPITSPLLPLPLWAVVPVRPAKVGMVIRRIWKGKEGRGGPMEMKLGKRKRR